MDEYIPAEFEIIEFDTNDIIVTSDLGKQEDYIKTVRGEDLSDDW